VAMPLASWMIIFTVYQEHEWWSCALIPMAEYQIFCYHTEQASSVSWTSFECFMNITYSLPSKRSVLPPYMPEFRSHLPPTCNFRVCIVPQF
jgi:hypothetical protein